MILEYFWARVSPCAETGLTMVNLIRKRKAWAWLPEATQRKAA